MMINDEFTGTIGNNVTKLGLWPTHLQLISRSSILDIFAGRAAASGGVIASDQFGWR
jgi:hypothetical protein